MAVPKLRFKEFDGDWSAQKYKDVLTIKYGKDHKLLEDGEIPVYGTGGVMRYVNQYLYDGESILIGRKGTIDQPKYVNEKYFTKCDILDVKAVNEIVKDASIVYNFAGFANLDDAIANPTKALELNVMGNLNILEACKNNNIKRFV